VLVEVGAEIAGHRYSIPFIFLPLETTTLVNTAKVLVI
jgi:hypothetical protein